jgi:hypothetical protein
LKPFSHSSLNFFIPCEMNSFEMFLEICKQPQVRRCQFLWDVSWDLQTTTSQTVPIPLRCFLRPANNHKSDGGNSFEMFLETCKQPQVRRCQFWPGGRVWNNFKLDTVL